MFSVDMRSKPMKNFVSRVDGFEGECRPVWLNQNMVDRITSNGTTGFFRLVRPFIFGWHIKYGEEFHGIIKDGVIYSTEGVCFDFVPPDDHEEFVRDYFG